MKRIKIFMLLCAFITASCSRYPKDVALALKFADDNRHELERVLEHYRNLGDAERLEAAYFLIGNMIEQGYYEGGIIDAYRPMFQKIDSMLRAKVRINILWNVMEEEWARIESISGSPSLDKANYRPDVKYLSSDYLIESIEQAFMLRDSLPWCKQLNKELFHRYILPYRVGIETPHNWRTHLFEKMRGIRDTTAFVNAKELAAPINRYIGTCIKSSRPLWDYPFHFTAEQIEGIGMGACQHRVLYTIMAMRANGIAAAMDYTPLWANLQHGHFWCVLMDNEHHYPFDAAEPEFEITFLKRKIAKVFRKPFHRTVDEFPMHKDIPGYMFFDKFDVTDEYVPTTDIVVDLPNDMKGKQYALIGTFNNQDWTPQYPGRVKSGKAVFKNMGRDIVYMTMRYDGGSMQTIGDPFLVDSLGNIRYLKADTKNTHDMVLYRKYPLVQRIEIYMDNMIGGRFVGSNHADHKDTVLLYEVTRRPEYFETAVINDPRTFRYLRYVTNRPKQEHVAELEFYGLADNGTDTVKLQGKVIGYPEPHPDSKTPYTNVFDGNTGNYFLADKSDPWVGMDFGRPQRIVKIRYCPRSDTNFIEPGDNYELYYWHNGGWISAGSQSAAKHYLTYKNIPSGTLYLLRNHTKGKEERIFTYENGEQVWW